MNRTMSEQQWLDIFADNLHDILRDYGYSQKDFAEATGISEASISGYISARRMPSVRSLVNMSLELGIMFDEFMDFEYMID